MTLINNRIVRASGQLSAQSRGFPTSLSVLKWNRKFREGVSLPYGEETKQGLSGMMRELQSGRVSPTGYSRTKNLGL